MSLADESLPDFLVSPHEGKHGYLSVFAPAPTPPSWLLQVSVALVEGRDAEATHGLARRINGEVRRLDGEIPFGVIHDWQYRTVTQLVHAAFDAEDAAARTHSTVQRLHSRALDGEPVETAEWLLALEPALFEVYRHAYPFRSVRDDTYTRARRDKDLLEGVDEKQTDAFARYFADMKAGIHADVFAEANAAANARACAAAYATADPEAYAEAMPFAQVRAYVYACAAQGTSDRSPEARDPLYQRLADGLVAALERCD
jgi:hypothetical protein